MASPKTLIKVKIGNEKTVFILCIYEPQKKLSIFLIDIDQNEAFSGSATDIDLRSQAASIRMSFNDFISLSTKALTQKVPEDHQFLYTFEKTYDDDFVFKWKSIDSDETIITIGCMKMIKGDFTTILTDVFSMLSEELLNMNRKLLEMESSLNTAEKQKESAIKLLTEALRVKDNLGEELYAKFVLVLNEKKRKIRELQQGAGSKLAERETMVTRKPLKKATSILHRFSDSSDEEIDGQLDDEDVPGPSSTKRDNSLLFFDEDEQSLPVTPSKMRKRNTTKATVSNNFQEFISDTATKPVTRDSESEEDLFNNL